MSFCEISWTLSSTSSKFVSVSIRVRSTPERISAITFCRGEASGLSRIVFRCGISFVLTNSRTFPSPDSESSRRVLVSLLGAFTSIGRAQSVQR